MARRTKQRGTTAAPHWASRRFFWRAADKLWNNVDAAEYKHVALGRRGATK